MAEYGEELTKREKEILQAVATGITNREVAYQLSISVNTVKVHLRNIFTKLDAESRTEATMIAVQEGWVQVEGEQQAAPTEQSPPGEPRSPLTGYKRMALLGALLLVAGGIALTWPSASAEPVRTPDLFPDQLGEAQAGPQSQVGDSPWQEHAQMPTRRAHLAVVAVGERIFALAGQSAEGVTGAVEVYQPQGDLWTRGRHKPTPVTYVSGAAIETEIYVPGGCDAAGQASSILEVYDTVSDSWRQASPLPEPRCAYALAALEDKVYLFGGWDGETYVATTYVYDPQADAWTAEAAMPTRRGFAAAAPLADRIYVLGGYANQRELTTCMAYTPAERTWRACAPLAIGRGGVSLVPLGGYLYAIGGGGWDSYLGFNERYNPQIDAWEAIETPLVDQWRSPGTVAFQNAIYAIGGWNGDYLGLTQSYEPLPFRIFLPVSQQ